MLLGGADGGPCGLTRPQCREHRVNHLDQCPGLLVAAAGALLHRDGAPFEAFEIGEHQLGLDRLDIADRIDRTFDVNDVAVSKAAHDMGDRIDLADVAEKLIAEPLAAGGAAHQAGDIDKFELSWDDLGRFREARADREPLVRHGNAPDIGLDRAKRVIRSLGRGGRGQGVEQSGLADIRQSDDAAAEPHRLTAAAVPRPALLRAVRGGAPPRS